MINCGSNLYYFYVEFFKTTITFHNISGSTINEFKKDAQILS